LEIIEARWLFNISSQQIAVMIHPQSIVHSMVEFVDGSVIAQLSPPDMKLPIQYALTWPARCSGVASRFDWRQAMQLDFQPPDFQRFGALELGLEVAGLGGTSGAGLNGANQAAVEAFLGGRLRFHQIVPVCRDVLRNHHYDPNPTLADVQAMDRWARQEVLRWIAA
jgi:1-deoxy-D-xylulose-5-phosphate reductoisomerase